jgi:hypothetical protein
MYAAMIAALSGTRISATAVPIRDPFTVEQGP